MENLYAVGVGLVLRMTIDKITHQNHRVNGSLVGLWEGAVLHHFLTKFPNSMDPYVGFGFRLFVDLLLTSNVPRLVIVVIWTAMGMLLSDIGWDMVEDKRFRRFYRRARRAVLRVTSRPVQARSPSRVQFSELPAGSSSATVSSARSPPILISRSQPLSQSRSQPTPAPVKRPTATPIPGSFSEHSVASSVVSRTPRSEASSLPSRSSGSQAPLQLPQRVQTPSELEYASLPVIPDTPGIEYTSFIRHVPSVASHLTTSSEGSITGRPTIVATPPPRGYSGLTTPAELSPPQQAQGNELPPVTIIDVDSVGSRTPTLNPAELTDHPPIPILLRTSVGPDDNAGLSVPPELADPVPAMPPDETIPIIPTPDVADEGTHTQRPASSRGPPPDYEEVAADVASAGSDISHPSVITSQSRNTLIARADKLREEAEKLTAQRHQLRTEYLAAEREKNHWRAFRLKVEHDRAKQEAEQLHAKAERRYYKAHNFAPEPQTIDVHRLKVPEAVARVEQALYDAIVAGVPELRIITGRGNHSKGKIPILKLAVIGAMQDHHIEAIPDTTNPGMLLIHPPANSVDSTAGPSKC